MSVPYKNGWHIGYDPKPIPDRKHDYDYWHDNYDGADGGNGLCGTAESIEQAIEFINEIIEMLDEKKRSKNASGN